MKNALLIYTSDREDGGMLGFKCAFPLPEDKTKTYQEAIEFLLPTLQSKEVVDALIKDDCLDSDCFTEIEPRVDGDIKLVFCGYRNYCLEYEFEYIGENPDFQGETEVVSKSMDFIHIVPRKP